MNLIARVRARSPYPQIAAVTIVALVIPLVLPELTFYMQLLMSAIVVVGLSLFMGYAGQAALGQGAFVAVGALTVGVFTVQWHLPPLLALVCAPIFAAAVAALIGWPLLRLRGHYLAFGTIAILLLVQALMGVIPLFGRGIGINGIPPLIVLPIEDAQTRNSLLKLIYVVIAVILLVVALILSHRVVTSRFGRGIRALAGSESAAASAGVPVLGSKLHVFVLAAVFAGLVGALGAFYFPFINPESFPPDQSFEYVIMAVVGGVGTLWGGLVGAIAVGILLKLLNVLATLPEMPAVMGPTLQYAGYGLVLVLVLVFMPKGLVPTITAAWERRSAARSPASKDPAVVSVPEE